MIDVPVSIGSDARTTHTVVMESELFQGWFDSGVDPAVCHIHIHRAVTIDGEIRLIFLEAMRLNSRGAVRGEIIGLRSPTTEMLTIVSDGSRRVVLLVEQFRSAVRTNVLSNAAGMIDVGETAQDGATREQAEEMKPTGITWGEAVCLNTALTGQDTSWFVSPGWINEVGTFFVIEGTTTPEKLDQLIGSKAGKAGEDELTTVDYVDFDDLPRQLAERGQPCMKTILAWLAYQHCFGS